MPLVTKIGNGILIFYRLRKDNRLFNFCLGKFIQIYFLLQPKKRKIQPRIKQKPPNGVIAPIQLYPGCTTAFIAARMYKEPENKIIPAINNLPDHSNFLPGYSL